MSKAFTQTLWWLIAGTRGGGTRARMILVLKERPMNAHQLANYLGADYKTTRQHLDLLVSNRVLTTVGEKYSVNYFLSSEMESQWEDFQKILDTFEEDVRLRSASSRGGEPDGS